MAPAPSRPARLAVMQPYFFPYLGYFQLIAQVDGIVLYDNTAFTRRSWMTRNRIARKDPPHETPISVPVRHAPPRSPTRDIEIAGTEWARPLLARIEHVYRRARHFEETRALLADLVPPEETLLAAYNARTIAGIARHIGLDAAVTRNADAFEHVEQALLGEPDKARRMIRRVALVCQAAGAGEYVNLPGGRALYPVDALAAEGVDIRFLAPCTVSYRQFGAGFVPGLSVIDALMHAGVEGTRRLVDEGELQP